MLIPESYHDGSRWWWLVDLVAIDHFCRKFMNQKYIPLLFNRISSCIWKKLLRRSHSSLHHTTPQKLTQPLTPIWLFPESEQNNISAESWVKPSFPSPSALHPCLQCYCSLNKEWVTEVEKRQMLKVGLAKMEAVYLVKVIINYDY